MTTTVIDTKVKEVSYKINEVSGLVNKRNDEAKILEIGLKYMTTSEYCKFTGDIHDAKTKQKELVNKLDSFNVLINFNLSTKLATLATKAKLKAAEIIL